MVGEVQDEHGPAVVREHLGIAAGLRGDEVTEREVTTGDRQVLARGVRDLQVDPGGRAALVVLPRRVQEARPPAEGHGALDALGERVGHLGEGSIALAVGLAGPGDRIAEGVPDAGLPDGSGPPVKGGAKLVQIDLADNRIRRVVPLEAGITPTSSLNDLRVDIRDGYARAYITDQGQDGEGAILAVDLASGRVVRRLAGHASTRSQKGLLKIVEDRPVVQRKGEGPPRPVQGGAGRFGEQARIARPTRLDQRAQRADMGHDELGGVE